ncbi:four-helix bundle copper-binding protein [Roseomonas sp. KE2513]|uniref:four-helix bundle copper-binding protein n=1 Tax=Roseomonas sp. KE2513 TaxID=2479202 RepID=UPI0018DFA05A|nr:four-helix bundle copper-binding protein [Roseomonas sp. KE2513]MBI0537441.1 four-helix bundle copper-binding protein [Roseomonas sp. KE2513]
MSNLYDGRRASTGMLRHIRICLECHRACLRAAVACLGHGGAWATTPLARTILDCSQVCLITADLMGRMPSLQAGLRQACIAACEECAGHCEHMVGEVPGMRGCAEACRRCADACRKAAVGWSRTGAGAGGSGGRRRLAHM